MKINNKVLVGFLVSVGAFSLNNAIQYVNTLTPKEKKSLISIANVSQDDIILCGSTKYGDRGS